MSFIDLLQKKQGKKSVSCQTLTVSPERTPLGGGRLAQERLGPVCNPSGVKKLKTL